MAVYVQTNQVFQLPDAPANISASDTGKVLLVPALGAARTYTLPAAAPGLHYTFIKQGAPVALRAATIAGPGAGNMKGLVLRSDASVDAAQAGSVNVVFTATAISGDRLDGTNWTAWGYSGVADGVGFTA